MGGTYRSFHQLRANHFHTREIILSKEVCVRIRAISRDFPLQDDLQACSRKLPIKQDKVFMQMKPAESY